MAKDQPSLEDRDEFENGLLADLAALARGDTNPALSRLFRSRKMIGPRVKDPGTGAIVTGAIPDVARHEGSHVHHEALVLAFRMVDHLGGVLEVLDMRAVLNGRGPGRPSKEVEAWHEA